MAVDILVVDDEAEHPHDSSAAFLEDEGYACREAADADSALAALGARVPSLVILDVWLQGSPGWTDWNCSTR